jgi:hypothetical protein
MDGYLSGADSWFNNPSSRVSTHYGVGLNGEVHQYVYEDNIAWANGDNFANRNSISIEFEDARNPMDKVRTGELYENGAQLIADICKRRNIPLNTTGIRKHNEFVPVICPGGLDINRLITRVNQILNDEDPIMIAELQKQIAEKDNQINLLNQQILEKSNQVNDLNQKFVNLESQNKELAKKILELEGKTQPNVTNIKTILMDFLQRISSRKFLLTLAAVAITVINQRFNIGLQTEDLILVASVIISFITLEGIKDIRNQQEIQKELQDLLARTRN